MLLDYTIKEIDSVQCITLSGELIDKNQALSLMTSVDELLATNKNKFIIDLLDLKYMNSSGLNVLIQLLTKTRNNGGDSVIFNVNKKVNDLLIITKLNTLFKVTETQNQALELIKK